MNRSTYELLSHLSKIENPTLQDCQLHTKQTEYRWLLSQGFIYLKKGSIEVKITLRGLEALESYELKQYVVHMQEYNLELQRANLKTQKSLEEIQLFMLLCTSVSVAFSVISIVAALK